MDEVITVEGTNVVRRPFERERAGEERYVYQCWTGAVLNEWEAARSKGKGRENPIRKPFKESLRAGVEGLLAEPSVRIVVAVDQGDTGSLYGFAAFVGATLVFAYVTRPLRGRGIGSMLAGRPFHQEEKAHAAVESAS